MNPFTKDLGVHQGRIASASAPEGTHVYELGHALLQKVRVAVGDRHEVSRTVALDPQTQVLRASIVITTPQALPVGAEWEVSAWLNGAMMVSRRLRPSKRVIRLDDLRISTYDASKAPATATLAFRLELV